MVRFDEKELTCQEVGDGGEIGGWVFEPRIRDEERFRSGSAGSPGMREERGVLWEITDYRS